jgi:hypothetical protein
VWGWVFVIEDKSPLCPGKRKLWQDATVSSKYSESSLVNLLNNFLAVAPVSLNPHAMDMKSYTEKTWIPSGPIMPLTDEPSALSISFNTSELMFLK